MNTQTAVEKKATSYPVEKPGTGDPAGNGGGTGAGGNGTGTPGTLPVPQQPGDAEQKLKSERVQEELKAMAQSGWAAINRDTAIENVQTFATPGIAGLYGAFAIQSAAASGNSVAVSISGNQVCVTVLSQDIDGCLGELTLPVLAFARQL